MLWIIDVYGKGSVRDDGLKGGVKCFESSFGLL